ncbi:MAG: Shikimate dehydrogenase [Rubritepida sp.]|nr:Shikimate dehydrogenase [Rubritepida sp.]
MPDPSREARELGTRASISGHTRLVVILAHPIGHVRTPSVMNAHFTDIGRDAVLVPMHVAPGELAGAVQALRGVQNLGGIIVTVPHKEVIAGLCDRLTEPARLVGAVNAIRREADGSLTGGQFDGEGFVAGLRAAGHEVRGRRVWMAGAGGAAAGIGFALLRHGVAALTIHNRTAARAEALAARLGAACPGAAVATGGADPEGHDIVVNATSLGLEETDALPIDPACLTPGMLAAEVIMQPEVTRFLEEAAARGCPTHPGLPMLIQQIPILADFVTGEAGR